MTGNSVHWLPSDVTQTNLPAHSGDVWHDRAVFHFLTEPDQRIACVQNVAMAVKPGGRVIVSTFGPEGPTKCGGLNVMRYDVEALHDEFGGRFRLVESSKILHDTPFGTTQQFLYCYSRLEQDSVASLAGTKFLVNPSARRWIRRNRRFWTTRFTRCPSSRLATSWMRSGALAEFRWARSRRYAYRTTWACFHTTMFVIEAQGVMCGIIPRTIGGPCAVLIAEQLAVGGAQLIVGLTSV